LAVTQFDPESVSPAGGQDLLQQVGAEQFVNTFHVGSVFNRFAGFDNRVIN